MVVQLPNQLVQQQTEQQKLIEKNRSQFARSRSTVVERGIFEKGSYSVPSSN